MLIRKKFNTFFLWGIINVNIDIQIYKVTMFGRPNNDLQMLHTSRAAIEQNTNPSFAK
jgi:hypothetical protein